MRRGVPVLVLAVLLLPPPGVVAVEGTEVAARALDFLHARQGADGGVDDPWLSSWTAIALAADGGDAATWRQEGGASLLAYLEAHDAGYRAGATHPALEAAKAVVAVAAAGGDPRAFNGTDHVARLTSHFDGDQFGSAIVNDDIWAAFALDAAGHPPDDPMLQAVAGHLLTRQGADGGWALTPAGMGTTDLTGWALNALALADRTTGTLDAAAVGRALDFLDRHQDVSGAFVMCTGPTCGGPNAESTAAVLTALHALGIADEPRWGDVAGALAAFQRDDGAIYRDATSTSWGFATPQAVVALAAPTGYPPARAFDPAAAVTPANPVTGESVRVTADADACSWSLPEGDVVGCDVTTTLPGPGVHHVTLHARTHDGGYAHRVLVVEVGNAPPTARLTGPAQGSKGVPLAFDASGSADPEGALVRWRFDLGDGTNTSWQAHPWTTHAFTASGTFTVSVTVEDAAGAFATATQDLRIANRPPVLGAMPDRTCRPGDAVHLTSAVEDADGDEVTVRWDLGDGNTTTGSDVTHAWSAGNWTVQVEARDVEDATATASFMVRCADDAPPTAAAPPADPPAAASADPPEVVLDRLEITPLGSPLEVRGVVLHAANATVEVRVGDAAVPVTRDGARFAAAVTGLEAGRHAVVVRAVTGDGVGSPVVTAEAVVEADDEDAASNAALTRGATSDPAPRETPVGPGALPGALLAALAAVRWRRGGRSPPPARR